MQVLFIRHGETYANRNRVFQRATEGLTPEGKSEMYKKACSLKAWKPTYVLASPMQRAMRSAKIISEVLSIPVISFEEVREVRWSINMEGKKHVSPRSAYYIFSWFFEKNNHYDDTENGESYTTLRKRIERTVNILETYPEDSKILVVSHSVFINLFTQHVCDNERMSFVKAVKNMQSVMSMRNTQGTLFNFSKRRHAGDCGWQALALNVDVGDLP